MKKILIVSSLCLILAACSSTPTDANWRPDMSSANFGKYPTNFAEIIKKWGKDNFDDAKSLTYLSMSSPREEYLMIDSTKKEVVYGYSVCANVSGAKSQGYYQPFQKQWYFIRDGKVIEQRDLQYGYNRVIYRDHTINCDDPA